MKNTFLKISLVLVGAAMAASACGQKGYTIKGNISGDADGKTVYLYSGIGPVFTPESIVDSTVISHGKFEFRGEAAHPDAYTLKFFTGDSRSVMGERGYAFRPLIPLFQSSGTVTIDAVFDSIPMDKFSMGGLNYDYSKIKVTGPDDLKLFMDYARGKAAVLDAKGTADRDYIAAYSGKDIPAKVAAVAKSNTADAQIREYASRFITENAGNEVGVWAFGDNIARFSAEEIDRLSAGFTPAMKTGPLGVKTLANAAQIRRTAVGAPFVDYSFTDKDGNPVKLSDHAGKGKYLLLEFWASWCGPCRADIPHLKEIYALYHPEGFEIISISMDADEKMWKDAIEKEQMPWLQVSDLKAFEGDLCKIYNFQGIPACVLVGPDGKIFHRNFRGPHMDKGLIELYGNRFGEK